MWMIGKISIEHHYLKKKIFTITLIWKISLIQIKCTHKKESYTCWKRYIIVSWSIWELLKYELAWQASLKKSKVKLNLLTDIDRLLIIEESIRGGICHSIYWLVKAYNKYMKDCDKNKEPSCLQYWDVNSLYG